MRVRTEAGAWIALVAASLTATLANPYGIGLWRFLATTVRATRADITEWQPLFQAPLLLWLSVVIAIGLPVWLSRHPASRPTPEAWAVIALLTAASLKVLRIASLLGPAALVLLAPAIARRVGHRGRFLVPSSVAAAILMIPVIVAAVVAGRQVQLETACLRISGNAPDRTAGVSLRGLSGRLWTTFDWGEYAIWHFGPALRVSIDGRRETLYSDAVVQLNHAGESGDPAALARITELGTDYVWLPSSRTAARQWLEAHRYRVDIDTGASFIAVRGTLPKLSKAEMASPPCFP